MSLCTCPHLSSMTGSQELQQTCGPRVCGERPPRKQTTRKIFPGLLPQHQQLSLPTLSPPLLSPTKVGTEGTPRDKHRRQAFPINTGSPYSGYSIGKRVLLGSKGHTHILGAPLALGSAGTDIDAAASPTTAQSGSQPWGPPVWDNPRCKAHCRVR